MGKRTKRAGKTRLRDLTPAESLELEVGPLGRIRPTCYASDGERKRVYLAVRDELLADGWIVNSNPGQRPWAWWRYEHGIEQPKGNEPAELERLGELRDDERECLEHWAEQRRQRDKANRRFSEEYARKRVMEIVQE